MHNKDKHSLGCSEDTEQPLYDKSYGALSHYKEPQYPGNAQDWNQYEGGMKESAGGEGGGSGLCRNGLAIVSYQINILSWEPFLAERIIMVVTTTMMTMLICVRCVKVWGVLDVWGCEGCDTYGNDCNDWSMEGPVGTILISYPTAACEEEDTVNNSALRYWLQATGYCYMHYSYLAM